MGTPTYPLASLAAQVTSAGISSPALQDLLNSLKASLQGIYGLDIVLDSDSQDGQFVGVEAAAINDLNNLGIICYYAFSPTFAQGALLSAMVKINGLRRQASTNSTAVLTLVGVAGTTITAGIAQDNNNFLWDLPVSVTIPNTGTIDVTATCETAGAIAAAPGSIVTRFTNLRGWQTVNNAAAASPGVAAETDAALRRRQAISTALPALTPLAAIQAAVSNVPGVDRALVYENPTNATDINGIPPHSISAVVDGGDVTAIAQSIESKKSPGTGTYGTENITVTDPKGVPITINFFVLDQVAIFVAVTIQALPGYSDADGTELINNIVAFINGLAIGQDLFFLWMYGPASNYPSQDEFTYKLVSLQIGLAADALGTADIPIAFNAAAATVTANVVLTVLPA
jgi:uncharacterized phage protein gp47/JayE